MMLYLVLLFSALTLRADFQEINTKNIPYFIQKNKQNMEPPKEKTVHDLFGEANTALKSGEYLIAIELYKEAIKKDDKIPQVHYNLGIAYAQLDEFSKAISSFQRAIQLHPDYTKAHVQLAETLRKKQFDYQALYHYQQALKQDENHFDAHVACAEILHGQEKFEECIEHYCKAVEVRPDDVNAKFALANALNTIHKTQDALDLYYQILEKHPDSVSVMYNIAYTLKKLGKLKEAIPYYQAVLEKKPDHAEAHFSYGLSQLITGNFKLGWKEYEWRWEREKHHMHDRIHQPQWDGTDLHGRTIFLYAEQGLGDTFQFIRYARLVKEKGAGHIIVSVQSPLKKIISLCPYVDEVIGYHDHIPSHDVQAALMSLPYIFKTNSEELIPDDIPYLYADPLLVKKWKEKLSEDKNFKVGICWQGNNKYRTPFLRALVKQKSFPAETFVPICDIPGVSVYSLQKVTGEKQLKDLEGHINIKTFEGLDDQAGRFMDTAAIMKNLDLVITIDTSIAHLSAGLGTPTWTFIPEPPDWRWMIDRKDTPWYPNMRLFRQTEQGNWETIMQTVAQELQRILQSGETNKEIIPPRPINQNGISTKPAKQTIQNDQYDDMLKKIEQEECSDYIKQLSHELASVNAKIFRLNQELKESDAPSPLDDSFMKKIRKIYMLNEMRMNIKEKINALIDSQPIGQA